jgi:hypothetical protein
MKERVMEPMDRRMLLAGIGLAGAAAVARSARGGPLDPPDGPVAPTYKTLDQVEPRVPVQSLPGSSAALHVISEPGSYYLTADLQGVAGKAGIEILAKDVVLDLAGFTMRGTPGAGPCIEAADGADAVVVRNGCIDAWARAIRLRKSSAIQRVRVINHPADTCLHVADDSVIEDCSASGPGNGIRVWADGERSIVRRCVSSGGDNGFRLQFAAHLEGCAAGHASIGLEAPNAAQTIRQFRAVRCGTGIQVDSGAVIEDCHAFECSSAGIEVRGYACTVSRNAIITAPTGILVTGTGHLLVQNRVHNSPTPYAIVPGNAYGPVVDVGGVGNIGSIADAEHPWANFIH